MNDETFESMAEELSSITVTVDCRTLGALLAAGMAILALRPEFISSTDNEAQYMANAVKIASEILNNVKLEQEYVHKSMIW